MKRFILGMVIALALGLSACGDDGGGASDQGVGADGSSEEDFNQADVAFAQGMIPHHEQAIEMTELAADNAGSDEVRDLAEEIEAAQGPEIEEMEGFLEDWDEPISGGGDEMGGMDHGGMSGMMSGAEMAELETATGAEFDQLFLEMMVRHHEGAVAMAEVELEDGINDEAQELAEEIIDTQEAEISEMDDLLAELA